MKYLLKEQNGFRHTRFTIDNMIIKTEIDNSFEHNQIPLGMVSLEICKAYNSVWKHRLIIILSQIVLKGNMFNYKTNFLKNRKFQVKINNILSNILFSQENGIHKDHHWQSLYSYCISN